MQSFSYSYNAAGYARASKDDADSSTIENQMELIKEYVKQMPDINIVSERSDSWLCSRKQGRRGQQHNRKSNGIN